MTCITLPCGCELTENLVVAMCLPHCNEMAQKRIAAQRAAIQRDAELLDAVKRAMGFPQRRSG